MTYNEILYDSPNLEVLLYLRAVPPAVELDLVPSHVKLFCREHGHQVREHVAEDGVEGGVGGVEDAAHAAAAPGPVLVGAQHEFAWERLRYWESFSKSFSR